MTTASAPPVTSAAATPVVAPATAVPAAAQLSGTGATPPFASLLGAASGREATGEDADELPPEAVALLLSAMAGVQSMATAAANRATGWAAPAAASTTGRSQAAAATSLPAPTAGMTAGMAAAKTDAAVALEAVLQDLLLNDTSESAEGQVAEPAAARADAAPAKEALAWVPGSFESPALRMHALDAPASHAPQDHASDGMPGWSDELAGRIAWIARENLQTASIRLSPEHLGHLDVQISVRDGDAVVSFGASHAETRAALEQALPKLREMLASQGLSLAEANVSDQALRQDRSAPQRRATVADDEAVVREGSLRLPVGLVDTYA